MKHVLLLSIFSLFTTSFAFAQKTTIKGHVLDSLNSPMPSATVMLLSAKDSTLVNFGVTDTKGFFEVKNVNRIDLILKITYTGFKTYSQLIRTPATEFIDLGDLVMEVALTKLDELIIKGEKPPVVIKKDTIEFNATTFRVNPNATVEDLLKKLPGVEVDNDGTVRAQGEEVQRVMVDGKNFFGTDPKVATRNLPADAIDKVQVFDKKSDQTVFSGIDDGQREKAINLELKEEKRNAAFGNLQAGIGTEDRFQAKANINRFKKGEQFSFLGMANNTNEQGFSIDDYMSFTGGAQRMMSGGRVRLEFNSDNTGGIPLNFGGRTSGILTNYAGGLNYNKDFSKKTELNTSYFYNYLDHDLKQVTERTNYLPGGDLLFNQLSMQNNTNSNHRINATLEHKLDSMNSLKLTTSANYNQTTTEQSNKSENLTREGVIQNESNNQTMSEGSTISVNATLLWRHRFAKKGRTLSASVQANVNNSVRDGDQISTTTYYNEAEEVKELNQVNTQETKYNTLVGSLSYTEPLGNRKYLEANYSFRQNNSVVDKQVYDVTPEGLDFNSLLSNQYTSEYQYHRAGLNFKMNRKKYNFTMGGSLQQTFLNGDLKLSDQTISKSYQNVLPVLRFNYDFSDTRHLNIDYETSVQEPTIQELQPVVDNSDPLNLYIGNPNLRPAYEQSLRINFGSFDPMKFVSFFAFMEGTYTTNAIVTGQEYTEEQVRISMPVNVDHSSRLAGDATFGFPIEKLGSRLSISANGSTQSGINVVERQESNIIQNTIGSRLRYDYHYKEILTAGVSASISRQSTEYDFNEQADQLFFNKSLNVDVSLSFLKNYQLASVLEYLVYESKSSNYKQSIPLLNLSLSRFVLKAKSGEIKLSVNNVLDKNLGVTQTASVNYFERVTSNSLGRYYMISFIYALNKQLNPMSMRPRGGMIRVIR